jgi:small subunit ribosomal protein S6e
MKKGEKDIDKVTNVEHPNRLAPKRAGNIRKMYALVKGKDDVCKYVNRRTIKRGDKTFWKAPSVQRLVTEKRLRRKVLAKREKKQRW